MHLALPICEEGYLLPVVPVATFSGVTENSDPVSHFQTPFVNWSASSFCWKLSAITWQASALESKLPETVRPTEQRQRASIFAQASDLAFLHLA